jgi:hypothetical protein
MADSLLKNKHLLWRAGFGVGINQIDDLKNKKKRSLMNYLKKKVLQRSIMIPRI